MKVRCSFTLEFNADDYRDAFCIEGEHMSVSKIRKELQQKSSDIAMDLFDEGIEVHITHHHVI